jgi:hypothetical protein
MAKPDRNATPTNSTFASRATQRAGVEHPPRRRMALRAGVEAEQDFEVSYSNGGDSVQQVRV